MRSIIYYFSGTGNNLALSKQLAKELKNTDILPITSLLNNKTIPLCYERIGFVTPSYYSHIPPIASEALKDLIIDKDKIIFSIIGCGGNRGHAVEDIRELLEACNYHINYEFTVMYPGNYILSYNAFPKWYQSMVINHSYKKIKKIADIINTNGPDIKLKKSFLYNQKTEPRLQEAIKNFENKARKYTVSDDCVLCGTCKNICPVQNISINGGRVTFHNNCQQCMACIQFCPKHAIDMDNIACKRKRYHHPDICAKDLYHLC